jgi:hypothetical protein
MERAVSQRWPIAVPRQIDWARGYESLDKEVLVEAARKAEK